MGDFLAVIGSIGVAVAAVALVRGRLEWAGMRNRRTAMFGFLVAAGILLTGTALASPGDPPAVVASKGPVLPRSVVDTAPSVRPLPTTITTPPTTTTTTTRPTTTHHTTHATMTPKTTTTTPAAVELTCAASVSDSSPADGSTVDVVVKTGVPGAQVTATAVFGPATTSHSGNSGSDGIASIPFHLSRWMYGYPVVVRVQVTNGGDNKYCGTVFTPLPN